MIERRQFGVRHGRAAFDLYQSLGHEAAGRRGNHCAVDDRADNGGGSSAAIFDDITVNGVVVPEPSSAALLGLGGLALLARRKRA